MLVIPRLLCPPDQVNTGCFESAGCGLNHTEGGWPKDIHPQDLEQTLRFRKKVEKDESYISSVLQLSAVRGPVWKLCCSLEPPHPPPPHPPASPLQPLELYARQNTSVDIYQDYFEEEEEEEAGGPQEAPSAKTVNVFR